MWISGVFEGHWLKTSWSSFPFCCRGTEDEFGFTVFVNQRTGTELPVKWSFLRNPK